MGRIRYKTPVGIGGLIINEAVINENILKGQMKEERCTYHKERTCWKEGAHWDQIMSSHEKKEAGVGVREVLIRVSNFVILQLKIASFLGNGLELACILMIFPACAPIASEFHSNTEKLRKNRHPRIKKPSDFIFARPFVYQRNILLSGFKSLN